MSRPMESLPWTRSTQFDGNKFHNHSRPENPHQRECAARRQGPAGPRDAAHRVRAAQRQHARANARLPNEAGAWTGTTTSSTSPPRLGLLRSLEPNERIVLVCAEAPGLSWPSFRKNTPDAERQDRPSSSNSGASNSARPTAKSRSPATAAAAASCSASSRRPTKFPPTSIASRFSIPTTRSTPRCTPKKLEHWLNGDNERRLIVVCYDDREITLNGKKVVGPDGGTFRATGRMHDALGNDFKLTDSVHEPFQETTGLDGRIHFYVHPNPENKILHTVLVGEMNGLRAHRHARHAERRKMGQIRRPAGVHEIRAARADAGTTLTHSRAAKRASEEPLPNIAAIELAAAAARCDRRR